MAASPQQTNACDVRWPLAITTIRELMAALRDGFDLVQPPGEVDFVLMRASVRAPPGVLRQHIAVTACRRGLLPVTVECADGSRKFQSAVPA